jgi:hypothetical protein
MDDSNLCEQGQEDDNTRGDAPVEKQATDQEDSIIDALNHIRIIHACMLCRSDDAGA